MIGAAMPSPGDQDKAQVRQARLAAGVMVAAALVWLGGQWVGGRMELDPRYAILLDLAALAAFFWALVVTWRIWRARRDE